MSVDGRLKQRLAEQLKSESETIQGVTQQQLDAMQSGLKDIYSSALTTIEADMRDQSRRLAKRFRAAVFLPSLVLVTFSIALSLAACAVTLYQAQKISNQRETMRGLESLGVEPVREKGGQEYLVFPKGASLGEMQTNTEGQPFIQLKR